MTTYQPVYREVDTGRTIETRVSWVVIADTPSIQRYRERHTISPEPPKVGDRWTYYRCGHDGFRVIPRRNGWRHDPDTLREVAR